MPVANRPIRTLVLSVDIGAGHRRAAEALCEAVEVLRPGSEVKMVDALDHLGPGAGKLAKELYFGMLEELPDLWGMLYKGKGVVDLMRPLSELMDELRSSALGRLAGLDLEVEDSHTGKRRPVSTLSGGEGFLASLSLALGLVDVVQRESGGIRLEAMFVDEGFGSLDTEALDQCLKVLHDLQSGGRLVGIISHVEELKGIDVRLEVTPGLRGSKARFVIP